MQPRNAGRNGIRATPLKRLSGQHGMDGSSQGLQESFWRRLGFHNTVVSTYDSHFHWLILRICLQKHLITNCPIIRERRFSKQKPKKERKSVFGPFRRMKQLG
jgi:hypothetical protein